MACVLLPVVEGQANDKPISDPFERVERVMLSNGLEVILALSPSASTVAVDAIVDVGFEAEVNNVRNQQYRSDLHRREPADSWWPLFSDPTRLTTT